MKNKTLFVILILMLIAGVGGLIKYINYTNNFVRSDAVFIKSDSLTFLSFKLAGKIEKIEVKEGDKIQKGEILAKLDTKNLKIQKRELLQNINSLDEKIKALKIQKEKLSKDIINNENLIKIQISKMDRTIEAKAYLIDAKRYQLNKLKKDYERFSKLLKNRKISQEKYEKIETAYLSLKDEIKADEKILASMSEDKTSLFVKLQINENQKKEIERLSKTINSIEFQKKALNEKIALLNQNIKDSFIYAPFNGVVAKKFVNDDEVVKAGRNVLSVVNLRDVYVLVYLQEDKLKKIKIGNEVKISIDGLGKEYNGKVNQILPASASTFALIPRDFSSGEFTKLQQRFFVKIKFDKIPKNIKVGMSAEVQIKR